MLWRGLPPVAAIHRDKTLVAVRSILSKEYKYRTQEVVTGNAAGAAPTLKDSRIGYRISLLPGSVVLRCRTPLCWFSSQLLA